MAFTGGALAIEQAVGARYTHPRMSILEPLFEALNRANVRYVVVGGVAVVLHGYPRLTHDVDLIVDLAPEEAERTIEVLTALGLRTRVPLDPSGFADASIRAGWARDKHLIAFSLWDPVNPLRVVDLFIEHPIPFDALWEQSEIVELDTTTVRIASLPHLIELKRIAGRRRDRDDIEALELIQKERDRK